MKDQVYVLGMEYEPSEWCYIPLVWCYVAGEIGLTGNEK